MLAILMLADYRQFGTRFVDNFAPKWTQVGSANTHRKFLGYSAIVFGVLLLVVGSVVAS